MQTLIEKKEIIKILEEIGTILELQGENPFKARAYFNAARTLESLNRDVPELICKGEIGQIKGIGKALSEKLFTLVTSGHLPYYEELRRSIPPGLFDLLKIPGMGPKKVKTVYDKLSITTVGELEYACKENRLRDLTGFGRKTQEKILQGIALRKKYSERFLYPQALAAGQGLLNYLRQNRHIKRCELAGSLRRKRETVKDIDIVASCPANMRRPVADHFLNYPEKASVTGSGLTKASIVLNNGLACDLRLVENSQFPFALRHFTGSKEHNTALRQRAKKMNLTMNEYGLFPKGSDQSLPCKSEEDLFKALGLSFIPAELRENTGEIQAAEKGLLPALIGEEQIKGLFHVHSSYSDGSASVREMAERCQELGFEYMGISDHSRSAFYANGLSEQRIKDQHAEIDRLNARFKNFTILKGIEADILPDGRLDYPDAVLASFDFVIASVHSSFKMSEQEMTARIIKAVRHPLVTMLGHPSGRLLLGREAYAVDMERILHIAARYNKIVEINANPHRLELDWRWGKLAAELKIKTAVNPDAHSPEGLQDYRLGVGIARKGWFTSKRVVNTFHLAEVQALFKRIPFAKS